VDAYGKMEHYSSTSSKDSASSTLSSMSKNTLVPQNLLMQNLESLSLDANNSL